MSKRAEIRMTRRWNRVQKDSATTRAQAEAEFAAMSRQMCAASTFADALVSMALCEMAGEQRKKYRPNTEGHGRAVARTVQPFVGHSESGAE